MYADFERGELSIYLTRFFASLRFKSQFLFRFCTTIFNYFPKCFFPIFRVCVRGQIAEKLYGGKDDEIYGLTDET